MTYELHHADCMDFLPTVPDGSIDAIIGDLCYGTTACIWDKVLPFAPMWTQIKRVLKPRGVFVTTASQPFTSALVMSNLEWFKYEWIWNKISGANFMNLKNRPWKTQENVLVFSPTSNFQFNPIRENRTEKSLQRDGTGSKRVIKRKDEYNHYGKTLASKKQLNGDGTRHPIDILNFSNRESGVVYEFNHPTKKPIALYEYLVRTYTNPGETILDFTMGSGTSIVAAIRTGRNGIGCELYPLPDKPIHERDNPDYFAVAQRRCAEASLQPALFQLDAPPVEKQADLL